MTTHARDTVVYVTYDGLLEPLGQSQVVAYMEKLAAEWAIHIVSFEKRRDRQDKARVAGMKARLAAAGIGWTALAYHKSPSVTATAFDIAQGTLVTLWLVLRRRAKIVHARSYVPMLMALASKSIAGVKLVFDMRGFWADERVDGGLWPKDGRLFRGVKQLEGHFIAKADHVVTLTRASAVEIERWPSYRAHTPPVSVIPTCANLERFHRQAAPAPAPFVLGYVGSVGTWYLLDEIIVFYRTLMQYRPDARMLFVNRNEHKLIRAAMQLHRVASDRFEIIAAEHRDVPAQIAQMHAAAAIIKPSYSKMSSAPTKLAEYLGCGVPCVGNAGVGDMEEILEGRRVGVALHDFSPADHRGAVDRLLALLDDPDVNERCVAAARDLFSLEVGACAYRQIYLGLCEGSTAVRGAPAIHSGES